VVSRLFAASGASCCGARGGEASGHFGGVMALSAVSEACVWCPPPTGGSSGDQGSGHTFAVAEDCALCAPQGVGRCFLFFLSNGCVMPNLAVRGPRRQRPPSHPRPARTTQIYTHRRDGRIRPSTPELAALPHPACQAPPAKPRRSERGRSRRKRARSMRAYCARHMVMEQIRTSARRPPRSGRTWTSLAGLTARVPSTR